MLPIVTLPTVAAQIELAEANRLADQRIHLARAAQLDLEKLRPRVCQLVESLTGLAAPSVGLGDPTAPAIPFGGRGRAGYGGYGSGGGGDDGDDGNELETISVTLRRLAEGRITRASRLGSKASLAARAQQHYALLAQEAAGSLATGIKSGSIGVTAAGQPARGREPSGGGSAGGASLSGLLNLHEELGAMGRISSDISSGSDNLSRLVASIQMKEAGIDARFELAVAAIADAEESGAVELAMDRVAARRMRVGEPYIMRTRRVVAGASPGEDDEVDDAAYSSAAPGSTSWPPPGSGVAPLASNVRGSRNPYARGGDPYVPRPPRRQMRDEDLVLAGGSSNRPGPGGGRGANQRWSPDYIPMARRRQLVAEEMARQNSVATAARSARTSAAVAPTATSTSTGDGASQAPALASAPALFFPPPSHARASGTGQPTSMPPAAFRFGRTAPVASPPTQAGLPPVFPGGASIAPAGRGRRARPSNRRSSRVEEAERLLRGEVDDEADPFFASNPHLAPPVSQYKGRVGCRASTVGGPGSTNATSGTTGSSPDPASDNAVPGVQPSSEYPPELVELAELYCGRCQEASARLRTAVSGREALSVATLAYLRSGRGGGRGNSAGSATRPRGVAGGTAMSAAMSAAVGAMGWKAGRGSAIWGGEGGQAGGAVTSKQACCAKCTEEVRCV